MVCSQRETMNGIRLLRGKMLVEPIFAGDRVGSIYIPESALETRPVLGDVIAAAADAPYHSGERVVLRPSIPTAGYPLYGQHGSPIVLEPSDTVGQMQGKDFLPKEEDVV